MLKRYFGFIIALVMAMLVITVSAEGTPTSANNEFKLLSSFGFFEDMEDSSCDMPISRGVFAKEAAFLEGYDGDNSVGHLIDRGVISGDSNGSIRENDIITGHEAIKMLVSILGYDIVAQDAGGYPMGYYLVAQRLDVVPDGFDKLTEELTYNDAAKLLLGAGNAVVANHSYYVDNRIFVNGSTDTAFYRYHNILVYQGIVNANEYTGFEGVSCGEDSIRIGSDILTSRDAGVNEYLGLFVRAYCVRENGDSVVKYIYPIATKNRSIIINSDSEPVASGSLQEFTVAYYDENDKVKTVRVGDYYPFYNGKYYAGFSLDKISAVSGTIEFIDNDNDNTYEIVKIYNYENYIIDSVNSENRKIYDKYGSELILPEDEADCIIYGQDGQLISIDNLVADDVLYVLKSEDGGLVQANVSRKVASGTVMSISTQNGRTVVGLTSDRQYELSPEFEALIHEGKIQPDLGMHVQLKLDVNGKVIDVVLKSSDVWTYGFITAANTEAEEDAPRWLKIYSQNKTMEKYILADKLIIDGVSRKAEFAFDYLVNPETFKIKGQLIKFKLNGNLISAIDTIIPDNDTNSLDRMEELDEKAIYYHKDTRMFFNGFETIVGGDSKTLVFNVPDSESKYNDILNFSITSTGGIGTANGFNAAGSTMIEAYDVDDMNIARVFLRYTSAESLTVGRTSPYLIFNELVTEVDLGGEVRQKLIAINPLNNSKYEKYIKDELVVPELSFGDLIRYIEKGGEVYNLKKDINDRYATGGTLNKLSEGIAISSSGRVVADTDETYVATLNLYQGKIQKIGSEHISMSPDVDGSNSATLMVTAETPIYCCKEGRVDTLEKISVSELRNYTATTNPDANACVVSRVGKVEFVIVYIK